MNETETDLCKITVSITLFGLLLQTYVDTKIELICLYNLDFF